MYIYLIRHGELNWQDNIKRCIGITDIELNERGIEKSYEIGRILSDKSISRVYSSNLKRCEETAKIVSDILEVPYHIEEDLREINMGIWENKTFDYIKNKYPLSYKERGEDIFRFQIKDGETFSECYKRAISVLDKLSQSDENIVLITHSAIIKSIVCFIEKLSKDDILNIKIGYGEIITISKNKNEYKILEFTR